MTNHPAHSGPEPGAERGAGMEGSGVKKQRVARFRGVRGAGVEGEGRIPTPHGSGHGFEYMFA